MNIKTVGFIGLISLIISLGTVSAAKAADFACAGPNGTLSVSEFSQAKSENLISFNSVQYPAAGGTASAGVQNNTNCGLPVSIATYEQYGTTGIDLSQQKFYDASAVKVIQANGGYARVEAKMPMCLGQWDLFYGAAPRDWNNADANTFEYWVGQFQWGRPVCVAPTPTPTPTPSATPTPIITPMPTAVPSMPPTPTPAPYYQLSIQKLGRNISNGEVGEFQTLTAKQGDTLEFIIKVRSNSSMPLYNVVVRDALPGELDYIERTTSVNNISSGDGMVATGLNIGTLNPNQEIIVRLNATVQTQQYHNGSVTAMNVAYARSDTTGEVSAQLPIIINPTSYAAVTRVQTGAGSNAVAVGIGATLCSLLYMRYTQTGLFRRREAHGVAKGNRSDKSKFNFV